MLDLAEQRHFEEVAHLLWTGQLTDHRPSPQSVAETQEIRDHVETCAEQAAATIDPDAPIMRLAVGVAAAATALAPSDAADPAQHGALLIDAMIAALPLVGEPHEPKGIRSEEAVGALLAAPTHTRPRPGPRSSAHPPGPNTSWPPSTPCRPGSGLDPRRFRHRSCSPDSAPSAAYCTAAQPAASTGDFSAGPTTDTATSDDGATTHADGFGHPVHRSGDPRHTHLHATLQSIANASARMIIDADLAAHAAAGLPPPNIDAALGALGYVIRGQPGITDAIFAIARTAGWVAHAFEEIDDPPLRYRGRTVYRGS